jgi:hypothetical protein
VGDVAEGEAPDRLAFLEAGLPGDLAGRDLAAVDGRPVGLMRRRQTARGHRAGDPAKRRSAHVLAHSGEDVGRRRAAAGNDA